SSRSRTAPSCSTRPAISTPRRRSARSSGAIRRSASTGRSIGSVARTASSCRTRTRWASRLRSPRSTPPILPVPEPMKIVVTGVTGQVGHELVRSLQPIGEVVALDSRALDLADPAAVTATLAAVAPAVVVNPAAYTAVDKAETEIERARAINAIAPGAMASHCARHGALLVHYSTDYVFDGTGERPYREDDPTAPANAYGRTKLEGEEAIRASGCAHLILRTSWVYSLHGANFLRTMVRLAAARERLS